MGRLAKTLGLTVHIHMPYLQSLFSMTIRNALMLMLLATELPVLAAESWTSVIEPRAESLIFVDLTRMETNGYIVKVWSLRNEEQPGKLPSGATYMSFVNRYEIDCKLNTVRGLQVHVYSETFAGGQAVASNSDPDKQASIPPPNSVGELILKFVCSKAMTGKRKARQI